MNELHKRFLASPEWAQMLETDLLPWIQRGGDLGDDVLEVGPGPGLTTDLLRRIAPRVTALELDEELARALARRLAETNVEVVQGDATDTALDSDRFSAAACFGMLHHLPTPDAQDRVFSELARVLRPGGRLLAVDALDLEAIRAFHDDDIFVPIDPETLGERIEAGGLAEPEIDLTAFEIRVRATKPTA